MAASRQGQKKEVKKTEEQEEIVQKVIREIAGSFLLLLTHGVSNDRMDPFLHFLKRCWSCTQMQIVSVGAATIAVVLLFGC